MRRGMALLLACVCAVLAGMVAVWSQSSDPVPWIAFDEMSVDQDDELVGTFRLMTDPQLFSEDRSLSTVPGKQVKIGGCVAAGHPWILEGLETVPRRLFYEIRAVRSPQASRTEPRTLEMVSKEIEVDRAILRHRGNGRKIRLIEVHSIIRRNDDRAVIYPAAADLGSVTGSPRPLTLPFVEESEPPRPVRHEPSAGPLIHLEPREYVFSSYYELADGRLVFWDAVNARLVVRMK